MNPRQDSPAFWRSLYQAPQDSTTGPGADSRRVDFDARDLIAEIAYTPDGDAASESQAASIDEDALAELVERLVQARLAAMGATPGALAAAVQSAGAPPPASPPPASPRAAAAEPVPEPGPLPPSSPAHRDDPPPRRRPAYGLPPISSPRMAAVPKPDPPTPEPPAHGLPPISSPRMAAVPRSATPSSARMAAVPKPDPASSGRMATVPDLPEEPEAPSTGRMTAAPAPAPTPTEAPIDKDSGHWIKTPRLKGGMASLMGADLDASAGLVLSMVDGVSTLKGIKSLVPHVPDDMFLQVFRDALGKGLVEFD